MQLQDEPFPQELIDDYRAHRQEINALLDRQIARMSPERKRSVMQAGNMAHLMTLLGAPSLSGPYDDS